MSPEMINAIAGLWKLITAISVLFALFLFRKPLSDRLGKLSRVKAKDTEVDFEVKAIEDKSETTSQPSKPIEEANDKIIIPNIETRSNNKKDLFGNMIDAFYNRDAEGAKSSFDAIQSSELDLTKRLKNEVLYHYFSYIKLKKADSIAELGRLSTIREVRSLALYWLSECYQFDNAMEKAILTLRQSLESATDSEEKSFRAKDLVDLLLKSEKPINEALEVVNDLVKVLPQENLAPIYLAYADIYEKADDKLLKAIAFEKAVEINPDDSSHVFNAAYAQAESELSALAITNYETVIRQDPDNASALNNLGVQYDKLDMPIESVAFYTRSSNKNETLAMSNMAYKFIGQGFILEAENLLNKAQQEKEIHPNVLEALAFIEKKKRGEIKKKEEIAITGRKQKNFVINYADARFKQIHEEGILTGTWKYNSENISITEKDRTLFAEWGKSPNKRRIKGEIIGCSISLVFENQITWITTSESFTASDKALGYISPDQKTISIMTLSKDKPEFKEFTRENS